MTKIVYDENIPYGSEAFSKLGKAIAIAGRAIRRETLSDADILIVRSVTRVDRRLLEGTPVRFVGTATIGTDHIDQDYLDSAGVVFSDAAGCNANSVSEYVTSALLHLEETREVSFEGKTAGIVGVGNVGRRVRSKLEALGMKVLLNDPPRAETEGSEGFTGLDTLLAESDLITLHTPLTRSGAHPTHHLVGEDELNRMKPGAFLFNTSRGPVVDGEALSRVIEAGRLGGVVLDVWEHEPDPDIRLLRRVDIATPHIAGYSLDGKLNGTRLMFEAIARYLGVSETWNEQWNPAIESPEISLTTSGRESIREGVFEVYPIREDDRRMRELSRIGEADRGKAFDRLRKEYPVRREFFNYTVHGGEVETLVRLGFRSKIAHGQPERG